MDREPASSKTFIRCPECLRKLPGHKYQCSLKNQGKMDWLLPDELNNRSGHELKKTGNRTFTQGITDKQIARRDFLKKISLVGVGAGLLGAGYLVGDAKAIPAPSIGSTIEPGSMESPASYLVFLDGSTILTRNGDTGINTYSNTDMGIILNNVSQELYNASGGGIYTKSGTFNMNTDVALDFQNNKSIMIKGSGMYATIIKYNGTGVNPFFFQNSIGSGNASGLQGVAASLNGSVEIDDMQLLFPSPVVNQVGLRLFQLGHQVIRNVSITGVNNRYNTTPPPVGSIGFQVSGIGSLYGRIESLSVMNFEVGIVADADHCFYSNPTVIQSNKYAFWLQKDNGNVEDNVFMRPTATLCGGDIFFNSRGSKFEYIIDSLVIAADPYIANGWTALANGINNQGSARFRGSVLIDLIVANSFFVLRMAHLNPEALAMGPIYVTMDSNSAGHNHAIIISGSPGGSYTLPALGSGTNIWPTLFDRGDVTVPKQNDTIATPADATSITVPTAGTYLMAGLAITFTPFFTGRLRLEIDFDIDDQTLAGHTMSYKIAYGTGTAPVKGAVATGTVIGKNPTYTEGVASGQTHVGQAIQIGTAYTNTGALAPGTTYWFDVQVTAGTNGDVLDVKNVTVKIEEW